MQKEGRMRAERVILAATDFSAAARDAVQRAALLAQEHEAVLRLIHVVNAPLLFSLKSLLGMSDDLEGRLTEQASVELETLASEIGSSAGPEPCCRVVLGDVVQEIADEAGRADLLVVGARGSSGLRDVFLGNTSERLLRRCERPVLIVKQSPTGPYQRVLVPVAFGPHSLNAVKSALAVAPSAAMTVFTAFSIPYESTLHLVGFPSSEIERYRAKVRHDALKRMDEMVEAVGSHGADLTCLVENGDAVELVPAKQDELGSDLVAIGKQGESILQEVFLGSVARHILSASTSDVLVVAKEPTDLRPEKG